MHCSGHDRWSPKNATPTLFCRLKFIVRSLSEAPERHRNDPDTQVPPLTCASCKDLCCFPLRNLENVRGKRLSRVGDLSTAYSAYRNDTRT